MNAVDALRLAHENRIQICVSGAELVLDAEQEPPPIVLQALKRHKAQILALLAPNDDAWAAEDWKAFFDKRAGIAEFDGGKSREESEVLAFECCVIEWMSRNPCRSDPGRCAACGRPNREEHVVVPFGTEDHVWLHPVCWQDWYKDRKAKAVTALAAMGIENQPKFAKDFGKNGSD